MGNNPADIKSGAFGAQLMTQRTFNRENLAQSVPSALSFTLFRQRVTPDRSKPFLPELRGVQVFTYGKSISLLVPAYDKCQHTPDLQCLGHRGSFRMVDT